MKATISFLHTLRSAEVESTGVAARVADAEGCKLVFAVRNVPYLLFSSAGPDTVDRPLEGRAPEWGGKRKEESVGVGCSMSL